MGYSASFTCKSKKAQAEMWAFMEKHYQDKADVGISSHRRYQGLLHSGSLQYARGDMGLGFNSPGNYEMSLLRWMALRVGKRRLFVGEGILTAVPWINYDNHESIPVLLRSEWPSPMERQEQYLVDEHGYRDQYYWPDPDPDPEWAGLLAKRKEEDRLTELELHRLSNLWDAR